MMLSAMPMMPVETAKASGTRKAAGEASGTFGGFLDRAMGRAGAVSTKADAVSTEAGAWQEKEDPTLSLGHVLERMRAQWRAFSAMGRQDMPAEASVLDVLRQMIQGSGVQDGAKNSLLEALDAAKGERLSLGELLDTLQGLAENAEMETEEGNALLSMGAFPFVFTLLKDMGIPEERIHALLNRAMTEGQGFSLERLGREWALLREDLTQGTVLAGEGGVGRNHAIGVLDDLLEGLRSLGADQAGEKTGFSHDTARMLERAVLSAMKERNFGEVLGRENPEFRLPGQEMSAGFLREIQPGSSPVGVTESREASLGKGVRGADNPEEKREKKSAAWERERVFAKERADETPIMKALVSEGSETPSDEEALMLASDAGRKGAEPASHAFGMARENPKAFLSSQNPVGEETYSMDREGDERVFSGLTENFSGEGGKEGGHLDSRGRESAFSLASEKRETEGERQVVGATPLHSGRGSEGIASRSAPAPPPPAYVMDQVGRKMAQAVSEGQNEVSFQLKPENLGRLHLRIESVAGGVNIRILAERKGTQEMLNSQIADLKAQMQEQGIRVERMEVSVAPDFDTALFREKEREREARKPRQKEEGRLSGVTESEKKQGLSVVRSDIRSNSSLNLVA